MLQLVSHCSFFLKSYVIKSIHWACLSVGDCEMCMALMYKHSGSSLTRCLVKSKMRRLIPLPQFKKISLPAAVKLKTALPVIT